MTTYGAATESYEVATVVVAVGGVASVADASTEGDAGSMRTTARGLPTSMP